jgi:ABC-2 type transport system permease protein
MIRAQKVRAVATFEFLASVKRPGYLIATFGMPLFMAAYAAVIAVPAYYAEKQEEQPAIYGVMDRAGVLGLSGDVAGTTAASIPEEVRQALAASGGAQALDRVFGNFVFRPFASEDDARRALTDRTLKGYFILPAGYLAEGTVRTYASDAIDLSASDARAAFGNLIRERLVSAQLDALTSARVLEPIRHTERFAITRAGEVKDGGSAASAVRFIVPLVFMVLFLISILMTSGYLMQGTATEKENKVVEVLLASANPDEILAGKLLGLGGAGLLQIAVWVILVLATGLGVVPLLLAAQVEVPWAALALAVPFFIVAFLFFGGLMLGTGSLGSNMREAQQLAMVWSLTAAVPLMLMAVLIQQPHGPVARVLTWVPFTAGPLVVLRASADPGALAWWEVAGSLAVLALSTWIALRIGARLFRIGVLTSGSRPSLREIVRQARLTS